MSQGSTSQAETIWAGVYLPLHCSGVPGVGGSHQKHLLPHPGSVLGPWSHFSELPFPFFCQLVTIKVFSDSRPEDGEMVGGPTSSTYPGVCLWLSVNKIQLFSALQLQPPFVCLCNKPRTLSGPRYIRRTKRGSETLTSERLKLPTPCPPGPAQTYSPPPAAPLEKQPQPWHFTSFWHSPPCLSSLKETCHQHTMSPLANHSPTPWPSFHPHSSLHPPTHQPACFIHPHATSTWHDPEHTSSSPHTGHIAAAEGHIHVASRVCSCRSFCQGHLLHRTWRNHTHPVKPKSGITSFEKPSRISPAESPVPALLPWYLGEGPKATPQPLSSCLPPLFWSSYLDWALLTRTTPVPSGPATRLRRPSLGGQGHLDGCQVCGKSWEHATLFYPGLFLLDHRSISLQMEDSYRKASGLATQKSYNRKPVLFPFWFLIKKPKCMEGWECTDCVQVLSTPFLF